MKDINYKYATYGLLFLLIVTYTWNWNSIFNGNSANNMNMTGMNMGSKNTHMMKMPDGSMMEMSNDSMGMGNSSMPMGSMTMDDMVGMMKGKTGKQLEKEFLTGMVPHHQGAVEMAKLLLQDKNVNPQVAKFAQEIIKAQESEINMMNAWLKNY